MELKSNEQLMREVVTVEKLALRSEIEQAAKEHGFEVHDSFYIELENYSLHLGVRDLEATELETVIRGIYSDALGRCAVHGDRRVVGGGDVRGTILDICEGVHNRCDYAALRILKRERGA